MDGLYCVYVRRESCGKRALGNTLVTNSWMESVESGDQEYGYSAAIVSSDRTPFFDMIKDFLLGRLKGQERRCKPSRSNFAFQLVTRCVT